MLSRCRFVVVSLWFRCGVVVVSLIFMRVHSRNVETSVGINFSAFLNLHFGNAEIQLVSIAFLNVKIGYIEISIVSIAFFNRHLGNYKFSIIVVACLNVKRGNAYVFNDFHCISES